MLNSVKPIFCPAGQWTVVESSFTLPFDTRHWFASSNVPVRWRYISTGIPWYWEGTFVGDTCIAFGLGIYTTLEFNPTHDLTVTWGPCNS